MFSRYLRILISLGFVVSSLFAISLPVDAASPKAASLVLVAPSACPSTGCAAGQRLNFKIDFDLGTYSETVTPNLQVCIYTPIQWAAYQLSTGETGNVTGLSYTPGAVNCSAEPLPGGYSLIGGAFASLPVNQFGDGLDFGLRIGGSAVASGSVLVRILEQSAASVWTRTSQAFSSVTVVPASLNTFVANDAAACGSNSPCYLNSQEDLPGGIGTGLKDAIDASSTSTTITILGNYLIKNQAVVVNYPHTLLGGNSASLTYSGANCSQPMLKVTAGAILRNLLMRDGSCTTTSRDLVVVESTTPVLIENSTFTGGKDAILVTDLNTANVRVQFNQILANSGYAIWLGSANTGNLTAVGNNIYSNRTGVQVECANHGQVDHNYWGSGLAAAAVSNCTLTEAKRLGAPVLLNNSGVGVSGGRVSVTGSKTYFMNAVGLMQSSGSIFDVYVIKHGAGSAINVPFTSGSPTSLNPCSSYWDIFLAENAIPAVDTVLSVFVKYDLTSGCIATISSTRYCAQPAPPDTAQFPIYWFDPTTFPAIQDWKTTGSTGQNTICQVADDEIQVDFDATGRPSLADLNFLPIVIGLPGQPTAVEIVDYGVIPEPSSTGWSIAALFLLIIGIILIWVRKGDRHA